MRKIIGVLAVCLHSVGLFAGINFGSPQSALEANGGSITFNPTSAVTLSNGTLRDAGSSGNIGNANGKSMTCTGMTIEAKEGTVSKSMKTDGTLDTDGGTLALGDNKVLTVQGGSVAQAVTVNGTEDTAPSIIQGNGAFASTITVSDNAELIMRWQGDLNADIDLNSGGTNSSIVKLENDLTFAPGKKVVGADNDGTKDIVEFNGHTITFNAATVDTDQQWDAAKVNLSGSLTIDSDLTLASSVAVINAQGNDIAGSGSFVGSVGGTIVNGKVTSASVLGGTGAWVLDNTIINHSSAAMRFVDGTMTENNGSNVADPFGQAVTLTSVNAELLTDVTASGAWSLATAFDLNGNGRKFDSAGMALASGITGTLRDVTISGYDSSSLSGSSATWNLHNVAFDNGSQAVKAVNGSLTSNTIDIFGSNGATWGASNIELLQKATLSGTWTLATGSEVHGNGKKMDLSSGALKGATSGATVELVDIYLDGLANSSLQSSATDATATTWDVTNVTLDNGSSAVRVAEGSFYNTDNTTATGSVNANPFGMATTWGASTMELLRNTSPSAAWTLTTGSAIHGNGKKLDVSNGLTAAAHSASFTLSNVYLDGVTSNSLASATGAGESTWGLTNVTFDSGSEAFRVLEGDLKNTANGTSLDTDPFTAAVTWTAANMELLRDTSPSGAWTVATSFALNGNGHKFDTAGITLPASTTGVLRNVTIDNADSSSLAGTSGSSVWNLHNTIVQDSNADKNEILVNGTLTSNTIDLFGSSGATLGASHVELAKDTVLAGEWNFTAASSINGLGNNLVFTDTNGTINYDADLTLKDVVLSNVSAASFDNDADKYLLLDNVTWHDSAQAGSVRIGLSPYTADEEHAKVFLGSAGTGDASGGALFGNVVEFGDTAAGGARIELLRKSTLSSTWRFEAESVIDGNNHVFNISGGILDFDEHLHLNNIILGDVANTSFDRASSKTLFMNNVTWVDNTTEGAIRIIASTQDSTSGSTVEEAEVTLEADSTAGELFNTSVTFASGVNMELLSNVSLGSSASWTFSETSVINGNGHVLDLSADPNLTLSEGTLTLSNMVITGWGNGGITFTGGRLNLSNVTIILDNNVTLESTEPITVNGPLTINTGSFIFDASNAGSNNKINGVTVWYDTLGSVDNTNAKFGAFDKDGTVETVGRVSAVGGSGSSADQTYSGSSTYVTDSLFLNYDVDVPVADGTLEASGQQVTLNNSGGAFTVQGNGRTFYLGNSSDHVTATKLITVSDAGSGDVTLSHLFIDGWSDSHIADSNDEIIYGDGAVLRLRADETLAGTVNLAGTTSGESIIIDLNGHDLDLGSDNAALTISDTDATVTIKNGRIINFDDTTGNAAKLTAGGATSTWVFQDVDLVLAGTTTLTGNNVTFKGNCSISGNTAAELKCYHTPITIDSGAKVTVQKGMTLGLYGNGTSTDSSITFSSNKATLELVGSTLDVSNLVSAPTFTVGTIQVDDIVTLTGSMTLGGTGGNDLDVNLMPAASIVVDSGTVTYANAS